MEKLAGQPAREPVDLPPTHRLDQRLSDELIAELVQAYGDGATTAELRQRYGLSQGSVLKLLRDHGVTLRWQGLSKTDKSTAIELYRDGASLAQLGARFGVSPNVVRRALLATGVAMQSRGGTKPRSYEALRCSSYLSRCASLTRLCSSKSARATPRTTM